MPIGTKDQINRRWEELAQMHKQSRLEKIYVSFCEKNEVPVEIEFDGEAPMYYGQDNIIHEVWNDIHKRWIDFLEDNL